MKLTVDESMKKGLTLHKEGKLNEAKRFYQGVLESQPEHPDANQNLGLIAITENLLNEGLPFVKQAPNIALNVRQLWLDYIETLTNDSKLEAEVKTPPILHKPELNRDRLEEPLGQSRRKNTNEDQLEGQIHTIADSFEKGQYYEAIHAAILLLREFPKHQFCWKALSIALKKVGKVKESLAAGEMSVRLAPRDPEAYYNLGNTLWELKKFKEAEGSFRQAVSLRLEFADAHYNLGMILHEQRRLREAEASYKRAIKLKPEYIEAHSNLGNILKELHRFNEAEACFNQAIGIKPDYAEAHYNLGNMLLEQGRLDEAEKSYTQAVGWKSDFALAYINLGNTLQKRGKLSEAAENYKRAILAVPKFAQAFSNLGNVLTESGDFDEAEANYLQAIELNPTLLQARSNFLFLNASVKFNSAKYLEGAQAYSNVLASQICDPYTEWTCSKDPIVLRIGFVSGDFKQHPVGYFLEGLLNHLQDSPVELHAYTTNNLVDGFSERLKGLFESWVSIAGQTDKDAAENIHKDGIHILIDLSGHTSQNRLPIFGWKPAPIQISWLGYFASTGLPEMDYILGDPFVTPESESHHFTEEIWQLPESYICFTPPAKDVSVRPLPALENGFLTFGCFNCLSRMTDEVISVRVEILRAVPNSKLFLKDKQLDHSAGRDQVLSKFASHGITGDRLILEGRTSREEYLACYHRVDIALSPFPYGGGTTSIEGLWMGVPVIAKRGNYFLSHLGESISHNSNLADWLAIDNDDYVAKAIHFSSDLNALNGLRQDLREDLLKTPLFDLKRFAVNFEKALREMQYRWN